MARITKHVVGADKLASKFKRMELTSKRRNNISVNVGYATAYALYVHENVEMKWKGLPRQEPHKGQYWDPQGRGQSKFLEQPFRQRQAELRANVLRDLRATGDMKLALFGAGEELQGWSQDLVPVDFGFLKGSAFTKVEK